MATAGDSPRTGCGGHADQTGPYPASPPTETLGNRSARFWWKVTAPPPSIQVYSYKAPDQGHVIVHGTAVRLVNAIMLASDDGEVFTILMGPIHVWVRMVFVQYVLGQQPIHWTADPLQVPVQERNNWIHFKALTEMTKVFAPDAVEPAVIIQDWLVSLGYPKPPGIYVRNMLPSLLLP